MLRQLFRFAAKHQNVQLSVYCGRAAASMQHSVLCLPMFSESSWQFGCGEKETYNSF